MNTRIMVSLGWFLAFCVIFAVQDHGTWRWIWFSFGLIAATSATTYTFVRRDSRQQALAALHIRRRD